MWRDPGPTPVDVVGWTQDLVGLPLCLKSTQATKQDYPAPVGILGTWKPGATPQL